MTRHELLQSAINEQQRRKHEVARAMAKHRQREAMLNLAVKIFTDQMTAHMDAQVWAMRNGI